GFSLGTGRRSARRRALFWLSVERLSFVDSMRGQNLERFIPYDLRATMHELPRIMDWCAGRLHLRFLTRELNHRSLEHVRNLLAIMEMAWNGRAGLNLDDPHDDFHVRAGQIDPLQDRVMHSRRMLDLLGSTGGLHTQSTDQSTGQERQGYSQFSHEVLPSFRTPKSRERTFDPALCPLRGTIPQKQIATA